MRLNFVRDDKYGEQIYTLRILDEERVRMRLHESDHLLLKECEASNKVSDKLLALETIARRIEEVTPLTPRQQEEGK